MAYVISRNLAGGQPISAVSTTAKHQVGSTAEAVDTTFGNGTFLYAKASIALLAGDVAFVKYATNFATKITDALAKTSLGLPAVVVTALAADEYGWLMRQGSTLVRCKPGVESSTALYVNASAGTLGGTTLSNMIGNIVAVTSVTTTVGAITCHMTFPFISRAEGLMGQ